MWRQGANDADQCCQDESFSPGMTNFAMTPATKLMMMMMARECSLCETIR
jgi:hypothetical protein